MTPLATLALLAPCAVVVAPRAHAQGYPTRSDTVGFVLDAAAEFGGDQVLNIRYRNGDTQTIRAGDGATLSGGVHFKPVAVPIDFAVTVGYKTAGTLDYHSDVGVDRWVFKATGTALLPFHWWVDAGPVWHTDVKVRGDGYFGDIPLGDAVGGTVGAGWRWIGASYTYIRYSSVQTGDVNGSSGGITFTYKF
jgi:hypothetical protein